MHGAKNHYVMFSNTAPQNILELYAWSKHCLTTIREIDNEIDWKDKETKTHDAMFLNTTNNTESTTHYYSYTHGAS